MRRTSMFVWAFLLGSCGVGGDSQSACRLIISTQCSRISACPVVVSHAITKDVCVDDFDPECDEARDVPVPNQCLEEIRSSGCGQLVAEFNSYSYQFKLTPACGVALAYSNFSGLHSYPK